MSTGVCLLLLAYQFATFFFASAEHKQRGGAYLSVCLLSSPDNYPTYGSRLLLGRAEYILAETYREMTNQGQNVDRVILGDRFDLSYCHQADFNDKLQRKVK
jgi:hypothetical protein